MPNGITDGLNSRSKKLKPYSLHSYYSLHPNTFFKSYSKEKTYKYI